MSERILYVVHGRDQTESRVADKLRERGLGVDFVSHRDGDPLPGDLSPWRGVVVGGGPHSVNETDRHAYVGREIDWTRRIVERGARYMGLCLGAQILAASFGARVAERGDGAAECGWVEIEPTPAGRSLFDGLERVYEFHYEGAELPPNAVPLARSALFANQAFRVGDRAWGFQFHPDIRPDLIPRWCERSQTPLRPRAHPLHQQLADAERHDPRQVAWLDKFLGDWLR
jgi:GMP synthase (glutamine-hydrolysing)